jgi:hypothetical protein
VRWGRMELCMYGQDIYICAEVADYVCMYVCMYGQVCMHGQGLAEVVVLVEKVAKDGLCMCMMYVRLRHCADLGAARGAWAVCVRVCVCGLCICMDACMCGCVCTGNLLTLTVAFADVFVSTEGTLEGTFVGGGGLPRIHESESFCLSLHTIHVDMNMWIDMFYGYEYVDKYIYVSQGNDARF